jgi:hypothetical protein
MIMRGRAVHIGPIPPQEFDLPLAKPRGVLNVSAPGKNRQKNQKKDFRQTP